MEEYNEYAKLVRLLFDIVINPYLLVNEENTYNLDKMIVVDDGDYQGTQLFIIP